MQTSQTAANQQRRLSAQPSSAWLPGLLTPRNNPYLRGDIFLFDRRHLSAPTCKTSTLPRTAAVKDGEAAQRVHP